MSILRSEPSENKHLNSVAPWKKRPTAVAPSMCCLRVASRDAHCNYFPAYQTLSARRKAYTCLCKDSLGKLSICHASFLHAAFSAPEGLNNHFSLKKEIKLKFTLGSFVCLNA